MAAMTALIATMTWVRKLQLAKLGAVDRTMTVVSWIVVAWTPSRIQRDCAKNVEMRFAYRREYPSCSCL
jgi:hypothetical protein